MMARVLRGSLSVEEQLACLIFDTPHWTTQHFSEVSMTARSADKIVTTTRSMKNHKLPEYDKIVTEIFRTDAHLFAERPPNLSAQRGGSKLLVKVLEKDNISFCDNSQGIMLCAPVKVFYKVIVNYIMKKNTFNVTSRYQTQSIFCGA